MVAQALTLSALVALTQAKAIVTNQCKHDVFVWSVPASSGHPENLPVSPGKRYEEPWRYGTFVNPGIAIKVSAEDNGINDGKSEIDFQYTVDPSDPTKIWINLSNVRGHAFGDNVSFFTCHGPYKDPNVPTRQCTITDDIELVLCGTERTTSGHDSTPLEVIHTCTGSSKKRDDPPSRPRQCSARVIGPKRKPQQQDERTDSSDDERPVTVPLKDVMRQEASKHIATASGTCNKCSRAPSPAYTSATTPVHGKKGDTDKKEPLCALLHQTFPGARCDEVIAEHNAKLFYADNCGRKTKDMFPGASCQSIRQEMKKLYPDVDKPVVARNTTLSHSKNKTKPLCDMIHKTFPDSLCDESMAEHNAKVFYADNCGLKTKAMFPGTTCQLIRREMKKIYPDVDKPIEQQSKSTDDTNKYCMHPYCEPGDLVNRNHTAGHERGVTDVCLIPAYAELGMYWGDLETTVDLLETIFPEIHWEDAESACTESAIERSRDHYDHIYSLFKKRTKHCVLNYCEPEIRGADCSDVEDALEKVSKWVGMKYDWTSDDDACGFLSRSSRNQNSVSRRGKTKACIKPFCEPRVPGFSCHDAEELMEIVSHSQGEKIDWTTDDDVCSPYNSRSAKPRSFDERGKLKVCVTPSCKAEGISGKRCKKYEKVMQKYAESVYNLKVDFTTDDDVC